MFAQSCGFAAIKGEKERKRERDFCNLCHSVKEGMEASIYTVTMPVSTTVPIIVDEDSPESNIIDVTSTGHHIPIMGPSGACTATSSRTQATGIQGTSICRDVCK